MMEARPITLRAACAHVAEFHRHNLPPRGHRFSIGCTVDGVLVGCAIVGRPVARGFDFETTAEVVRVCVPDGAQKGMCSFLYAACWRAWKAMGGKRMITYTLQSETGASLRGAGWIRVADLAGRDGVAWQNRADRKAQAVVSEPKYRWEVNA